MLFLAYNAESLPAAQWLNFSPEVGVSDIFVSPPSSTPGSIHQRCGPFRLRAVTLFLLQRKHMLSVNISGRQGRKELIIYFDHQKNPQIVKGGNVYSKYLKSHSVILTFAHLICRRNRV